MLIDQLISYPTYNFVPTVFIHTDYELINVLVTLNNVTDRGTTDEARGRVSKALEKSGVPISITTISYVAAFVAGTQSDYLGVQLVSIFSGENTCKTSLDAICNTLKGED